MSYFIIFIMLRSERRHSQMTLNKKMYIIIYSSWLFSLEHIVTLGDLVTLLLQQWLSRAEYSFTDGESLHSYIEPFLRIQGSLCECTFIFSSWNTSLKFVMTQYLEEK